MINNKIKNIYSQIVFGETNDPKTIDLIFNYFNSNPNYYFEKYYSPEVDKINKYKLYKHTSSLNAEAPFNSKIKNKHYLKETRCYRCKKPGHIAKYCEEIFLKTKLTTIYDSDDSQDSIHSVPYDFDIYDD